MTNLLDLAGFIAKRLLGLVLALLIVSVITFGIIRLIGNPLYLLLGPRYTQEMYDAAAVRLGLDLPMWQQYGRYLLDLLQGDLGVSRYTRNPVVQDLMARIPATLELSTFALLLGVLWAVPAGIRTGMKPTGLFARFADTIARIGVSMPNFWLALLLILLFFAQLKWLPSPLGRIDRSFADLPVVTGWLTIDALLAGNLPALGSALRHLILPALALAITTAPSTFQVTRASTIDVMGSDHVRSARAFGLSQLTVYRYALKTTLAPIVTMITMTYGFLISGTVLIEVVFAWPGIGLYAVDAMNRSDYEPVMGVVLFSTAFYMTLYILADVINVLIDPRERAGR